MRTFTARLAVYKDGKWFISLRETVTCYPFGDSLGKKSWKDSQGNEYFLKRHYGTYTFYRLKEAEK